MKQGSTLFLKLVLLLIGGIVLTFLLTFPHFEGRNVNADLFTIYFKDPFLAYIYLTFIPFFVGLYQAIKLLGYIEQNNVFSQVSVNALQKIKYCAYGMSALFACTLPYIFMFAQDDDSPGVVLIGLVIVFAIFVVGTAAAVFQSLLQKAVDLKSENDLTV